MNNSNQIVEEQSLWRKTRWNIHSMHGDR